MSAFNAAALIDIEGATLAEGVDPSNEMRRAEHLAADQAHVPVEIFNSGGTTGAEERGLLRQLAGRNNLTS